MSRFVSVWLPAWPVERLRRVLERTRRPVSWIMVDGREMPFALVETGPRGLTLTAVNGAAWLEGIRPGRTLADARAGLPSLLTRSAEQEEDRRALHGLATWAGRYGPRRNVEGSDGIWIDITGVAHLFGGETELAADLAERLARADFSARVGLADTAGAAFALARFATSPSRRIRMAPQGDTAARLAPLPVEALRLSADAVVVLRRLGLRRIGQLYDLPRETLAQRFRSSASSRAKSRRIEREAVLLAGSVLGRLDAALGRAEEPRAPIEEPPLHSARMLFAEPLISTEGVGSAIDQLADDLEALLAHRDEGGTRFVLGLYRADGTAQHIAIGASRPCRRASHLVALLADRLDTIDAGFGIDAMTFAATHVEPLGVHQIALAGGHAAADDEAMAGLVDRLSNRIGTACVVRLVAAGSHIPERAEVRIPLLSPDGDVCSGDTGVHGRPPFLLAPPEPIAVLAEVPEGPPLRFSWRRRTRRITRAEGPERIAPEWWRAIGRPQGLAGGTALDRQLDRPRDYYRVEDEDGGRYWVFRAGLYGGSEGEDDGDEAQEAPVQPVWFMHGVFG